ncbi:uncharacterized protein BP5553_02414 [Venustampulla echinocandica]|uniref:Uncharacterized protein n=1 Tax=Venustampulla echinocandica TaxID=2656787 RepID=A0A370U3S8_9HELO|nr:uncharacterized protein BP5553_02414 [Venustampulla echinocandica]RDL42435.1 hypothetical protein BP5553_02414 [Venustampulla echinocandica]
MASTEPGRTPPLARRSTFQRMLDLERRNKVNLMKGSPNPDTISHTRRTSITQHRAANPQPDRRPALSQPNDPRAKVHTPKLSVSIPQPDSPKAVPTKKYVIRSGTVVSQEKADGGSESDRSSICRSPGWDDITGNKRKKEKQAAKEKRKAEKGKLETKTDTKHAQRMKNRLSKPPPTNNRLTKLAIAMDRSSSSPALQMVSGPLESKQDNKAPGGNRSRRGSIDVALKSLINATQGIPSLWKNSPPTTTHVTPTQESPSSGNGNGFIGGLKLRLSEQAAAQDKAKEPFTMRNGEPRSFLDGERDSASGASREPSMGSSSRAPSLRHKAPLTSIYHESARTAQDPIGLYDQAGRLAQVTGGSNQASDSSPVVDRNVNLDQNPRGCISGQAPVQAQPNQAPRSYNRDSSKAGKFISPWTPHPNTIDLINTDGRRSPSRNSFGESSHRNREPSQAPTNNGDVDNHAQKQHRQSPDLVDDDPAAEALDSTMRRSPSFHSVKSRVSAEAPAIVSEAPAVDFNISTDRPFETQRPFSFFSEYTPPRLDLNSDSSTAAQGTSSSQQIGRRGFKGLNARAKSPFRRQSTAIQLPEKNLNSSSMDTSVPPQTRRSSATGAMDGIVALASKAQGVLGGVIQSLTNDSSQEPPTSDPTPTTCPPSGRGLQHPGGLRGDIGTSSSGHRDGAVSHVRSATDSSEEYSTLDEFSNATTPMASRPQSQKEYSPGMKEVKPHTISIHGDAGSSTRSLHKMRRKAGAGTIPYDEAVNRSRDSWSRSAMPIDFASEEDHHATSTGSLPIPNSSEKRAATFTSGNSQEPSKEHTNELQRQSSISRSASTPELQDLSFLPTLRHQALTKPPDKKGNGTALKKGKQLASSDHRENKQIFRPPPIPLPGTKSEGNSPNSPTGGQYLRDARLNIPRPLPSSPNRNRFPSSPSAQLTSTRPQQAPEPIAKMFVICCSCKYFHDMPSKIYQCMAQPDNVVEDKALGVSGVISTSVKCPWCAHGMSTACCAGYAAVVYLSEKVH